MKIQTYTVYDQAAEAYTSPFFMNKDGQAKRFFGDMCQDPNHQFGKHPSDYTLFHLGAFDDNSAGFTHRASPKPMGNGLEYLEPQPPEHDIDVQISDGPHLRPDTPSRNTA